MYVFQFQTILYLGSSVRDEYNFPACLSRLAVRKRPQYRLILPTIEESLFISPLNGCNAIAMAAVKVYGNHIIVELNLI